MLLVQHHHISDHFVSVCIQPCWLSGKMMTNHSSWPLCPTLCGLGSQWVILHYSSSITDYLFFTTRSLIVILHVCSKVATAWVHISAYYTRVNFRLIVQVSNKVNVSHGPSASWHQSIRGCRLSFPRAIRGCTSVHQDADVWHPRALACLIVLNALKSTVESR